MKVNLSSRLSAAILTCILSLSFMFSAFAETENYGPGYPESWAEAGQAAEEETAGPRRGESLGIFNTTGYCNCSKCSAGHSLTYSGTVPTANHTLSADLSRFPVGTKLMINDVVYTVEDKGSGVHGDLVDIYFDTHEQALAHGLRTAEVYTVIEGSAAADITE